MLEPLLLDFEDGAQLRLTYMPRGSVQLHARGPLNPTATAIDIEAADVEQIRAWLNKHDAANRAHNAREAVAPKAEPLKQKGAA